MKDYLHDASDKPYVAAAFVKDGDKLDYGVRGMKWGVRRSSSELKAAAAKRDTEGETKAPSGPETSSARYARLAAEAKAGRGSQMSDADLKFFNARTEALKKVNALNQKDSSWLKDTTKNVLQNSAKKSMQEISNQVTDKYITKPLLDKIAAAGSQAAARAAVNAARSNGT